MKHLLLFDVDGTLTQPRQHVTNEMFTFLNNIVTNFNDKFDLAIVGGSNLEKQREQLGDDLLSKFTYIFSENGLSSLKNGKLFHTQSIRDYLGQTKMNTFVNWCLKYISNLDIPVKTGTFIELRTGMFNISPIGRNCTQEQRKEFKKYNDEHKIMETMIHHLRSEFTDYNLQYSIGGEISFDVFPVGFDKTYCLQFVKDSYTDIHFFGDKTELGGNDYEIYNSSRVIGHKVCGPDDTIRFVSEIVLN